MNPPPNATATLPTPDSGSVLCPACGYDLRAATGDRCSECGLVIDLTTLGRSSIPWMYRGAIGRVRAFLKTVWLITVDARSLRHEAARPQSAADAARFRRWVAATVALSLAIVTAVLIDSGEISRLVWYPNQMSQALRWHDVLQDLVVPWSAGIALTPALYGYVVLAAIHFAAAPAAVFRTRGMLPEQAEASRAMGNYAAAPLVLLLPAAAALAAVHGLGTAERQADDHRRLLMALMTAWALLGVLAIVGTLHRTGQWRARVTRGGYATGFPAMGELLLRWAFGLAVLLCVVPWCVGFLWIFIDSFLP